MMLTDDALTAHRPRPTALSPLGGHGPRPTLLQRLLAQLGAVSLFYKVLLANGALVLAATATGMALTGWAGRADSSLRGLQLAGFAAGVAVLSLLINALVLRAAFSPLQRLEETADAVRHGAAGRRAPHSVLSDPTVARLIDTFNAMLEAQERQRDELAALSSRTLDAQEEERRRIARELHDETAQELTALLLRIRLAANGSREPATRERLAELRVATARTLDGVRRLARELRPTILDDLGLVEAVRACAQDVATREGLHVDVCAHGLDGRLHPARELVLYRVVQEALSNVAKHADAHTVRVTLDRAGGDVVATVVDDGRGFDLATAIDVAPTGRGLGLLGMRERLALVGGDLEIDAPLDRGTRVRARVPLTSDERRGAPDSQLERP